MWMFALLLTTFNRKKLLLIIFIMNTISFSKLILSLAYANLTSICLYFKGLFVLGSFLGFRMAVGMKSIVTLNSTMHGCSNYGLWLSCVKLV